MPRRMPAAAASRGNRAAKTPAASRIEWPPAAAWSLAGLALVLLLVSPPCSNRAWALNGARSVAPLAVLLLASAAALAVVLAWRPRVDGRVLALLAAIALAFPLREHLHLLGDTWVRSRYFAGAAARPETIAGFAALGRQLHAQPLDNLVGGWGVIALGRLGVPFPLAVSLGSALLALAYFAGVAHLARRLAPGAPALPLALALALAGTLEVFAGYAESGGVVLATGVWWWALLLQPLSRRRDAAFSALAWLALFLGHRLALVGLVPQLARGVFFSLAGDRAAPRRWLVVFSVLAAVLAVLLLALGGGSALGRDFSELGFGLWGRGGLRLTPASDLANLVAAVMPLALLAPLFAGREALRALLRSPLFALHVVALLPLAPMLLVFPVAAHGLGAHRDWEIAALPGLIATSLAGAALGLASPARRRGALVVLLPLLAILAGGWLATNASDAAVERRAIALAEGPHGLTGEQQSYVLVFLGYLAADRGDDASSARWFDESFGALANSRNALLAAESWLRAGDVAAARRSLVRARSVPVAPELEPGARALEAMVARAESAGAAAGAPR